MKEISTQSSQLEVHLKVKSIERENKEKNRKDKEKKMEAESLANQNSLIQLQDDLDLAEKETVQRDLIDDVVVEFHRADTPIPPSVMKLLNNFKGTFCMNSSHLLISNLKHLLLLFLVNT